jgi:hypothetical protein
MKQSRVIWIIIFIIGFGVRSTELFHPLDSASWRENDLSSIARNYYRGGMDFSHPQIDWSGTGPGFTESEFPIYPYLIALSFKFFGVWEPTGRIISFLFSLLTLIIFFRLSRFLFDEKTAIAVSFFFAFSPILMITSNSIQPESTMFFFYISSAYTFLRWMDNQSHKYYLLTIFFTAFALLCKITAISIEMFFVFFIIYNKGLRYLFKPKVILLGILSIVPSIIWYTYSHKFYILYGNSLGLSNEYAWIGLDFLTNGYFIKGIIRLEVFNIWTIAGPLIVSIALISTKLIKKQSILIPATWLAAVVMFYIITSRTSADTWAYYYHIFSVPSVSMLLGISIIEIYNKYLPHLNLRCKPSAYNLKILKSNIIIPVTFFLVLLYAGLSLKYLTHTKKLSFKTSDYYACRNSLSDIIPSGTVILASGGFCRDKDNFPLAFNASYFFYWLDMKGYNISVEDQSIENVIKFKNKGAKFYIAEIRALQKKQGFEEILRKEFKIALECNGIILFTL